ncbi:GNAT family N-acetyltransferase [Micrococcoides hystricis]|uniref:GNAT family N-acetyltransferase n=1 Tax=Micrococcoides hystricis TaxID=1572761 RepID=A0ABV6P708_9MICC
MRLVTLFAENRRALLEIVNRGWPAVETSEIDGWIVRFSSGVTKRANSVLTLHAPENVDEAIREVERRSVERWLPASFQVGTFSQPDDLDQLLSERGYESIGPTTVQAMERGDLQGFLGRTDERVTASSAPSQEWLEFFWEREAFTDPTIRLVTQRILTGVESVFYELRDPETTEILSIAKMSLVAEYGGLYCLYTHPDHRGQGHARALIETILSDAAERDIEAIWLQVEDKNTGAIVLYNQLGFDTVARYHYRVKG